MIEKLTSQFDWLFELPIEAQCHFAIGLSLVGFLFAAIVRETCKESSVRYVARAVGAASFFAVAAFANHVSHEYEKLNTELMVRRGVDAQKIADPVRVLAVASEYSFTTPSGLQINIEKYREGGFGPVSTLYRRSSVLCDTVRSGSQQPAANRRGDDACGRGVESVSSGQSRRF